MKKIITAVMIAVTAFLPQSALFAQDQPEEAKDLGRAAYDETHEENHEVEGSEALEMITQRMKDLTGSLQEMPEIPQLNQTLMIPGGDLKPNPQVKASEEHDKQSETEQKENTL